MHYLYKITNLINNKIYIGQTISPDKRWYAHRKAAANPRQPIAFAIKKYGAHNFEYEVIACALTQEDSNESEILLIKQYNSYSTGYNATEGGKGMLGRKVSNATREKISAANKGKKNPHSKEWCEYMSNLFKNREFSEEHRSAISAANKGKKYALGQKRSEVAKKNMSDAQKGRRLTEEHKQKLRDAKKKEK